MKTEDNKKQEELTDEQLDNVSGGGEFRSYEKSDLPR
jgi:bacteriocin-like protein